MGRTRRQGERVGAGRGTLLTTTALSAATALMVIAAPNVAAAQWVIEPDFGDHMIVDGAGVGVGAPPSTQANFSAASLYIGANATGFLTIRNGGVVRVSNSYMGYFNTTSLGEAVVTGAGSLWGINQDLIVGGNGSAAVTVADGGLVTLRRAEIAGGGDSDVLVSGVGSALRAREFVTIGGSGAATLTITGGGAVSNTIGWLGSSSGSTGEVTVTGAGSTWTNSSGLAVGISGAGVLTIADGGAVSANGVSVASYSASTGVLNFGAAAGDAAVAAGTLTTPTITFGSGAASVVFNHTDDDFSLASNITGAGIIRLLSGHTTLTGASSYTGSTRLEGGTLTLGSSGALGGSTLTTTGSVVDYADGVTIANPIVIDSNTTQFQVLTGSATQSGVISELNGPRPFEKIGAGELVLTADNSWTGKTTVTAGTLTFDRGSVSLAADLAVGEGGGDDGALIIRNGGAVSNTYSHVGYDDGSVGEVTVTGGGSTWTNSDNLYVGVFGTGALTVADAGAVLSLNGFIGGEPGAIGEVTITGAGSRWTNSNELHVGHYGSGALTIADGGRVSNTVGYIGEYAGSTGQVTVTGAGSEWSNNDQLLVGRYGDGALTIADGGAVYNASGLIGYVADSTGAVTVTDADSLWSSNGSMSVGYYGDGALTVANGGGVSSEHGLIGDYLGATGDATVTGAGSLWTTGDLFVGYEGIGSLTVADGGAMSNVDGYIAAAAGSTGEVTVTGADSVWTNSDELFVGFEGGGTLTVADGGTVRAASVSLGSQAGGVGTLNIGAAAGDAAVAAGSVDAPTIDFGDGDGSIVFNHTSDDFELGADISGAGTLRVLAGRTLLSGDSTYTGPTLLEGGTLSLGSDTALGGSTLTTFGSGIVDYADGVTIANAIVIDSTTTQFQVLSGSATQSGVISELNGPRPFEKIGAGELVLTADNSWTGHTTVRDGTLTFDGGTATLASGSSTVVGELAGEDAALVIRDGASVSGGAGYLGLAAGAAGEATVTGAGSLWINSGDLDVGGAGDGTLTVADGAVVSSRDTFIAYAAGSTGTVTVTGVGSTLTNSDGLTVGAGGDGVLTIADGATVSNGQAAIGSDVDSVGRVVVTGVDSVWTSTAPTYVGWEGDGGLAIEAGGAVSSAGAFVGVDAGAAGAVSVTGPGSRWADSVGIVIGAAGDGVLTLADGGAVSSIDGAIGRDAGSTGTVAVTGPGSVWTNDYTIQVGQSGDGSLSISDGAQVASQDSWIGGQTGSTGTVSVTGPGSGWQNTGGLVVGGAGAGALTLSDGAVAANMLGLVGYDVGATGVVSVTGAGSLWQNQSALVVGAYGNGNLTVADGGQVTALNVQLGFLGGAAGAVAVTGAGSILGSNGPITVGGFGDGVMTLSNEGLVGSDGVILADGVGGTGVLNIGAAAGAAAEAAGVLESATLDFGEGAGTLVFNHTAPASGAGHVFDADVASDAAGDALIRQLAGFTRLTGDSTGYQGDLAVTGGRLAVDGVLGSGGVAASVGGGGVLTGAGVLDGDVTILSGGVLAGASGQTFTVGGDLTLQDGATVSATLGSPGGADLFAAGGDLTLDGTLNIVDLGGFGAGIYGLISYGGSLTDHGLTVGATPDGVAAGDIFVQTAVAGRVNLISTAGVDLVFWDGGDAARYDNGAINGGSGVWSSPARRWTDASGAVNGDMRPMPGFAVFMGTAGTVTVDGAGIGVSGMQFAVDGYAITGDGIALTAAETILRVGDGTAAGAGMSATVAASLTGSGGLVKTDLGTLVLTGTNCYAGGTVVRGGTLIGDAASIRGDLVNDAVTIFDQAANGVFSGAISGAGSLIKDGAGGLTLTGSNSYTGGLKVRDGILTGDSRSIVGAVVNDATLVFDQAFDGVFAGAISGAGAVVKDGAGALTLSQASDRDWSIADGTLDVGAAAFTGDVSIGARGGLRFAATADTVWGGVLSGAGAFAVPGAASLTLTGDSSGFLGNTIVSGGALRVDGALGGDLAVAGGSLGGTGSVLGTVSLGAGRLVGVQGQTLTLESLALAAASAVDVTLGTASTDALFDVTGDVTLDGTLTITDLGGFGAGVYRLFDYGGGLTDNGLEIGATPDGVSAEDLFVQTAVSNQLNLVSTFEVDLRFWDGAAGQNDGVLQGGAGTWSLSGRGWTGADGAV
ncbi:MAG: autotransporter-associated beta strand repeat-containing protein, partial [Brevundimonas sp.]|uniref:autotransporter-associated beta strand repeat-containing protein n=1 Tax=Brevundimonas sp. TaxID=1871086 RepID=UPI003918A5BE